METKDRNAKPKAMGYSEAGASTTKRALRAFFPNSSSPNEDINYNLPILRSRARTLYMASPVATSAVNTNRTKVVGTGLTLKSTVDRDILMMDADRATEWQKKAETEFSIWADDASSCDALGINNFYELQQLAMKSWLMSGDVFALIKREPATALKPYSLRIHLIEADRISTPIQFAAAYAPYANEGTVPEGKPGAGNRIYDGVEVDKSGKVIAYYVCSTYPRQALPVKPVWTRVLARGERTGLPNILHIMDSERPDQLRGVPYLAQVIEPLLQLRRFTEAQLMAALVQSFFSAWIETEEDPTEVPFNEVGGGDYYGEPGGDGTDGGISESENEYEMSPGTVIHLEKGEKVVFGNPNIPTAGFEEFTKALCRMVGSALELPYDVLIKEFNSSYSASRGAILEAWEAFKMRRAWFVNDFCRPVYELWMSEAVALGRIKAPGFFDVPEIRKAYLGTQWIGPVQGQLDPKKEADAAIMLSACGIKTHEQITREMGGGDWHANIEQLKLENGLLEEAGAKDPAIGTDYDGYNSDDYHSTHDPDDE